jgi:hypothetical protein
MRHTKALLFVAITPELLAVSRWKLEAALDEIESRGNDLERLEPASNLTPTVVDVSLMVFMARQGVRVVLVSLRRLLERWVWDRTAGSVPTLGVGA